MGTIIQALVACNYFGSVWVVYRSTGLEAAGWTDIIVCMTQCWLTDTWGELISRPPCVHNRVWLPLPNRGRYLIYYRIPDLMQHYWKLYSLQTRYSCFQNAVMWPSWWSWLPSSMIPTHVLHKKHVSCDITAQTIQQISKAEKFLMKQLWQLLASLSRQFTIRRVWIWRSTI